MTPEEKIAYNKAYYAARKERFRVESLARYHAYGKHQIDRASLAEYQKRWRAANPEKAKGTKDSRRKHQLRRTERYNQDPVFRKNYLTRQKAYHEANPKMIQKINLKRKYALSLEDYEKMITTQGGKCAICGESSSKGKDKRTFLHVDHCHSTKKVRGLLCQKCNRALGLFNDNIQRIKAAAEYLERSGKT